MQPILDTLGQLGVKAFSSRDNGRPPLVIKGGGINGGPAEIDGSVSSQFVSGLLIAGIFARTEIELKIRNSLVSRPYILATLATMGSFGVLIDHNESLLQIHIPKASYSACAFDVPSDFSTAALIMAAGALVGEKVVVKGLNFRLPQGDSKIIEILREMGCDLKVDVKVGRVTVTGSDKLYGGDFDLSDTPDLLPVISILALKASTPVTIRGVAHARVKETDRIANIAVELKKFGAEKKEFPDGLKITSPKKLRNASLEAYDDHRLFMAFTIAAMLTNKSIVAGAESVDVSYPSFISDMVTLGAKLSQMPDRE
jgi:3-phosphoshikimate 1-carboxyvinyltransferase